jgi:hypothetical protein
VTNLNADNITAGTIIGRTVKANGGSGADVWVDNTGAIYFRNSGSFTSTLIASGNDFAIDVPSNFYLFCDQYAVDFNNDGGGEYAYWLSAGNLKMQLTSGGELRVEDDVVAFAGIDFAEMFESVDGQAIPFGTSVVLDGEKVRPARSGESPIGAISSTPGYICNGGESDAGTAWDGKYLRDEFMRPIYEEAEWWSIKNVKTKRKELALQKTGGWVDEGNVPRGAKIMKKMRKKINPEWDPSRKYVPRSDRPEWNVVGLIGRVRILKGQPVADRWIKLREISENVDEWLIR